MTCLRNLLFYCISGLLILFATTLSVKAQTAHLRIATQLNCADGLYSATLQIRASDATSFSIGTSSLFLTYSPSSLSFVSYESQNFDLNTLCSGIGLWEAHSIDGATPGLFNLTMVLNGSSISCPLITTADWISIGTLTFRVRDPDANPMLQFDAALSSFNAVPANNGQALVAIGQYTGVNQPGALRCPTPVCSLTATASPGNCDTATNTYTLAGTVSATNTTGAQTMTITVGDQTTTATLTGNGLASYTLTGLPSDGLPKTVSILSSASACSTTSLTYTAPASCTVGAPGAAAVVLQTYVSKSVAKPGDVLTYTLVLTNTSAVAASSIVVTDILNAPNVVLLTGSATTTSGTINASTATILVWTAATLPANGSATATFSVSVAGSGIAYNTASLPGDTVSVCTSVPYQVCKGTDYAFLLAAEAGQSSYQWYHDGVAITGATAYTTIATQAGSYSVLIGGTSSPSSCTTGSCCPFIIEEIDEVAAFSLTPLSPTCSGTVVQMNGRITLTGLTDSQMAVYTYQLTQSASFTSATSLTPTPLPIPANGVLNSALQAGTYTVRVYNQAGCYRDQTVQITQPSCVCPDPKCLLISVQRLNR
ncbi:putative repeat protein (TIGR01451 family) [Spirosoma lacussanchae]|uniref:DUF11 domain-containing protein n=1 Tax=Spirosoma lacussanchae TaxID=1884249 RepID=UPI001107E4FF|nr:DUF11 domain-containing protein [Spirosoma lacussanchae]